MDRYARISVRQCRYSVPVGLIGRPVRVRLSASEMVAYDGFSRGRPPQAGHGARGHSLKLDHYLEILLRKPGALPGATALVQGRAVGVFTSEHDAFCAAARNSW